MLTHLQTVLGRAAWRRWLIAIFTCAAPALTVSVAPAPAEAASEALLRGASHETPGQAQAIGAPRRPSPAATPFTSSLAEPEVLWSLTTPGQRLVEGASSVVFSGGLLYVTSYSATAGQSSLSIVSPVTHEVLGSVTSEYLDGAASLAVSGAYAYVTGAQNRSGLTNANRLTVIDVSEPKAPTILGSVHDNVALYGAYGVQLVGSLAYVAAQGCVHSLCTEANATFGNRLVIVDVSEKSAPRIVGSVAKPTGATDHLDSIALAGNRAYGTAFNKQTLTVFDVSKPEEPTIIGSLNSTLLSGAADVVVRGRYAYVIDQSPSNARLVVVDVADPAHLKIVGSVSEPIDLDEGYWLKLVGHDIFVAAANADAMTVVDVSEPEHPRIVATNTDNVSKLGDADGIEVAGQTAYVAAFCTAPDSETECSSPTTGALTALDVSPYTALDLTAGPPAEDTSSTPAIEFSSPVAGTTFACSLDGAPATSCTSPFVACEPLQAGAHSLSVEASTDPIAATWAWTILPSLRQTRETPSCTPTPTPPSGSTTSTSTPTSVSTGQPAAPGPVAVTAVETRPDAIAIASPLATYSRGKALIVLTCAGLPTTRCRGTLELKLRTIVHIGRGPHVQTRIRLVRVGSIGYSLAGGASTKLSVALTAIARATLAHLRSHRLQVQVSASVVGGTTATRGVALLAGRGGLGR